MDYAGRRVLVTGAGGFIGSHLVEALVRAGARVTGLVRYNALQARGHLEELDADVRAGVAVVAGDVRDPFQVQRLLAGQEWVFHLAALIGIPYSLHAPHAYVATNVHGTLNLLEAARAAAAARVVVVSSSEVYGTAQYVPIDERHPLHAQSPYAASKIGAESLALSYHASFDLPVAVVRPFNTYGPRQSRRAVIPAILAQLVRRAPALRLGATAPRRDFTYVADTVDGLLRLGAAAAAVGTVTNLASGRDLSIAELAGACAELVGYRPPLATDPARVRPAAGEVQRLCGDHARATATTGWQPRTPLREGLAATLRWIERHRERLADDDDVL